MNAKRAKAQEFILKYIDKLAKGGQNKAIYERLFSSMDDKTFDTFMKDIKSGKKFLCIIVPNFSSVKISVENNLKLAEELGHSFFERIWIEGNGDTPTYLTPIPYMIIDLPVRRASQLLIKGISVPDHNKVVDVLTGQPTGESKGAKISYPELQLCVAMGLENSMIELMKYRGGDLNGLNALNSSISKTGSASLGNLSKYSSGVESTKTLKTFLNSIHLRASL